MARKMVCEWGMSEALGPLTYGKKEEQIFLGKEFNRHQDYSEATALQIDAEIKRIVTEQYERAAEDPHRGARPPWSGSRRRCWRSRSWTPSSSSSSSRASPWTSGVPRPAPPPPREGKIEHEGERAGGILPPLAPKPTS